MLDTEAHASSRLASLVLGTWFWLLTNQKFVTWRDEYFGVFNNERNQFPFVIYSSTTQFKARLPQGFYLIASRWPHQVFRWPSVICS